MTTALHFLIQSRAAPDVLSLSFGPIKTTFSPKPGVGNLCGPGMPHAFGRQCVRSDRMAGLPRPGSKISGFRIPTIPTHGQYDRALQGLGDPGESQRVRIAHFDNGYGPAHKNLRNI